MRGYSLVVLLSIIFSHGVDCQRRIVGGTDATDGMFPFAAFLLINQRASCTGSLLTDSWVLTAAHCVDGVKPEVKVFAGSADKSSPDVQVRYSKEVKVHNSYVKNTMAAYDIALVKLEKPFNMSSPNIGTILLTSEEWPQNNQMKVNCTALGWGRISTEGKVPNLLQYVEVVAKHGSSGCPCVKRFEQKKLVCLEGTAGKGPCMGDSGGPLVCDGKEVGITHMGFTKEKCNPVYPEVPKIGCGQEDTVVAYIFVCPLLDWVKLHVPEVPETPISCTAIINSRSYYLLILLNNFFLVILINFYHT